MYRIIKVLNNNAILALDQEKKREIILLGNGIGFGKHPGEEIKMIQSAKIYTLVTKKKQTSAGLPGGHRQNSGGSGEGI